MLDNFSQSQIVRKPAVFSRHGIVAAQHIAAANVGATILAQDGDAVDAAIATSMALGVVEPWMSGLSAGGCMIVWRAKEKRAYAVNFGMHAPRNLNPADYPLSGRGMAGDLFPWQHVVDDRNIKGATAVAVPGLVAGMALAHEKFGTKPWKSLVMPAAELAQAGMIADWYSALLTAANARDLIQDPDTAAYFLEDGRWPIVGGWTAVEQRRLNQSTLAQTLRTLAQEGARAFYDGSIGQALIKDIQAKGGCMSMQDLENYQAQLVEPLSLEYARGRIFSAPELTGGPTFMQALQRLVDNSPTHTALDGKAYQDLAAALAAAFDHRLSALGDHESPKAPGSTTHFSVVDREGNMCSVTQTLLSIFGSRVTSASTGLLLNNGIMWFDPEPGKPNSLAPGKRCLTNYCPVIGHTADGLSFAVGASGGRKILGSVLQLSRFMMQHGLSLEQAFEQPRIDVSGAAKIMADPKLGPEILAALEQVMPVSPARRNIYPYAYACPAGVARQDDWNYGCTELFTPWGDAIAADQLQ